MRAVQCSLRYFLTVALCLWVALFVTSAPATATQSGAGLAGGPGFSPKTVVEFVDHGRVLTPAEQVSLVSRVEITTESVRTSQFIAQATYCGTASAAYKGYNASGQKLYEYRVSDYWCWNGTSVVSANTPYAKVTVTDLGSVVGWSFEGHATSPYVQKLSSIYRAFGQGHFKLSPIRVGSIQHTYPWVQLDMKKDGTYYATWGKGN